MFKSRRFFLQLSLSLLIIFAFYFIKKLFGDSSSFIKEYTDKHISLSKNEIEVFSKLNGRSGLTNIARSIISDHKNDRTLFVESFLYSETEIKILSYDKLRTK